MSNLTAALAAYLQNNDTIGPLISGVISDRNFENQEYMLANAPFTCLVVSDLARHESPYIGTTHSGDRRKIGQVEVRVISRVSDAYVDDLSETILGVLWTTSSLPWAGSTLPWGMVGVMPYPDIDQATKTWFNIMTIDYES